jgi:phage shock protein PspC (stress-responsive transcriptional regulator)
MKETFAQRWRSRGLEAGYDLFTAVCVALVAFTALRDLLKANPGAWVVAELAASALLLVAVFGRHGTVARVFSVTLFVCAGILALYMLMDGLVVPPLLFVGYSVRAWRIELKEPTRSLGETVRAAIAAMAAGIPAGIANTWGLPGWWTGVAMAFLYFLSSAVLRLYPFRV